MVRILQAQPLDDVSQRGRLGARTPAQYRQTSTRQERACPRERSTALAKSLLRQAWVLQFGQSLSLGTAISTGATISLESRMRVNCQSGSAGGARFYPSLRPRS